MRNAWRGSRWAAILLVLISAASCGGGEVAEEDGAENDTLAAAPGATGDRQISGDDTLFAALRPPPGALQCTPPGNDEPGTTATVGPDAGSIVNNPGSAGAVRPSKVGYRQQNGAQPRVDTLREVAATYPASETTVAPGRLTNPEQGYSGCDPWEGNLTLYFSINGSPWLPWSVVNGGGAAADSIFVGADEPDQPITEPDTTRVDIRSVKTRFALGTS